MPQQNLLHNSQIKIPDGKIFNRSQHDIKRAVDEVFGGEYSIDAFSIKYESSFPIEKAVKLAYPAYAPFITPKSLVGKEEADIVSILLEGGSSEDWCKLACNWLKSDIPAIVFVAINQGEEGTKYILGDGHHRLALADAVELSVIGAIFVKLKKKARKNI